MAHPVVHFEIGCKDKEATTAFYQNIFGWTIDPGPTGLIDTGSKEGVAGHLAHHHARERRGDRLDRLDFESRERQMLRECRDVRLDGNELLEPADGDFHGCTVIENVRSVMGTA